MLARVVVMGGTVMTVDPKVVVDGARVVVFGGWVDSRTETVGWGWIVTGRGVGKKTGTMVVVFQPVEEMGVPLEYSGILEGGAVTTLGGSVIWTGEGFTLCKGLMTAVVGSPGWTVTGHQSIAVVVMASMAMVVVMVRIAPPASEDSSVVVNGGHGIVVFEPICEGGSTSVQGGIHKAVAPPPGAQTSVGT